MDKEEAGYKIQDIQCCGSCSNSTWLEDIGATKFMCDEFNEEVSATGICDYYDEE